MSRTLTDKTFSPSFEALLASRSARNDLRRSANVQYVVCHKETRVCYVLTNMKTLVVCSTGVFLIKYDHRNYRMQLERLRLKILRKQMKSMTDLIDYCRFRPGAYQKTSQMCGLELVPTKLERHI